MLFELEQECLEVYRRKVDLANRSRAQLRQAIADCEAELAAICSSMGERPVHIRQVRYFKNCYNLFAVGCKACLCITRMGSKKVLKYTL